MYWGWKKIDKKSDHWLNKVVFSNELLMMADRLQLILFAEDDGKTEEKIKIKKKR